jgi:hypothetical protein
MCNIGDPVRMVVVEPLAIPAPVPGTQPELEPEPALVPVEAQEPILEEVPPKTTR